MEYRTIQGCRDFVVSAPYLLRAPEPPPAHALPLLVALHGQGMSASLFGRILRHLPVSPRYLLIPEGPYPFEKRSREGIDVGHAWYIYQGDQSEFLDQLLRSEAHLLGVLDDVVSSHAVDPRRIVLLGFSQGGYLAGFVGLRHPRRFSGLVLASTRLKWEFLEDELAAGEFPATLFLHAENDPAVKWEHASRGFDLLAENGGDAETHMHDEGHRLPAEAVEVLGGWLARKGFDVETNG